MSANRTNDWRTLCEAASKERDPQKLLELVTEINKALEEEYGRSNHTLSDKKDQTPNTSATGCAV